MAKSGPAMPLLRAFGDGGVAVAVLGPGAFVIARIDRPFLAVGNGGDARAVDAVGDQKVTHGIGPAGAEGEVVFARAAFVTIAFDADLHRRIAAEPAGLLGQDVGGVGADGIFVGVGEDRVAGVDHEVLARAGKRRGRVFGDRPLGRRGVFRRRRGGLGDRGRGRRRRFG